MGLFDNFDFGNPLPNIPELPDINVSGFLPNFDIGKDLFGSLIDRGSGSFSDMFGWTDNAPTFGGGWTNPTANLGGWPGGSVLSGWPNHGFNLGVINPPNWNFPWNKPAPTPGGMSGGIGSATGGYEILNQYDAAFMAAAAAHGGGQFDANWLKAIAAREGGWGKDATSGAGALGIMQIMPGGYPAGEALYPNWRTDPTQNIMLGAYILSEKIRQFGGRDIGTQRYLGTGTDPYTGISTEDYLSWITNFYNDLNSRTVQGGGAPFTGQAGSSYLSIFGGQSYSIASYNGVKNGAPESWYYAIDDELGLPIGTHAGLDVGTPMGTTLYMPSGLSGVVEVADGSNGYGFDPNGGVARSGPGTGELLIRLSNGHIIILGHMQRIFLSPGQRVTAGQALGLSGGAGSGPHVHFEYRIPGNTPSGWISVDPRQYLR